MKKEKKKCTRESRTEISTLTNTYFIQLTNRSYTIYIPVGIIPVASYFLRARGFWLVSRASQPYFPRVSMRVWKVGRGKGGIFLPFPPPTFHTRMLTRGKYGWLARLDAYYDVRVFHPNAPRNRSGSLSSAYKKHEDIKKRAYGQRVRDIFTLLFFSPPDGTGSHNFLQNLRLADILAWKQQKPYSVVISCKLSFAGIRSSIMCIRGTRSSI